MSTLVSIAVIVVTAFATEWVVDGWIGEAGRFWVGIGGVGLLALAGVLIKASGIEALVRSVRNAVIGAGIGAALNQAGQRLGWLRSGLRMIGIETDAHGGPDEARRGPGVVGSLFQSGWVASLIGLGMVWTGIFGG